MKITGKYILFAGIATLANLLFQDATLRIYRWNHKIFISILIGTIVGLAVKYVLDKKYIFKYQTKNFRHNSKTFVVYCAMGLVTTIIFWGSEFLFEYLFHDKALRYVGAVLGLMIGYLIKYRLDKKYVFTYSSAFPGFN